MPCYGFHEEDNHLIEEERNGKAYILQKAHPTSEFADLFGL